MIFSHMSWYRKELDYSISGGAELQFTSSEDTLALVLPTSFPRKHVLGKPST